MQLSPTPLTKLTFARSPPIGTNAATIPLYQSTSHTSYPCYDPSIIPVKVGHTRKGNTISTDFHLLLWWESRELRSSGVASCPYFHVNARSEGGILCTVAITEKTSVNLYCGSADCFASFASGMWQLITLSYCRYWWLLFSSSASNHILFITVVRCNRIFEFVTFLKCRLQCNKYFIYFLSCVSTTNRFKATFPYSILCYYCQSRLDRLKRSYWLECY